MRLTTPRAFLCLLVGGCLFCGAARTEERGALETALEHLRLEDITTKTIATAYGLLTNAPTVEIRGYVIKACAAGLLFIDRQDLYAAQVRKQVTGVADFERSLTVICAKCKGAGKTTQTCASCGGSGNCGSFNCREGIASFKQLGGKISERPCPACKGTGRCRKCAGTGEEEKTCSSCLGKGAAFSPAQALSTCKEQAEKAIASLERIRLLAEEQARKTPPPEPPLQKIDLLP
jgi:hypothetical protein